MLALLDFRFFQIDGTGVTTQEAIIFIGICIIFAAIIKGILN